ncbi:protein kinase [Wenzhouxiangella sp. XN79A]|uniref:serine/threonine-protein kinase n=1 Tax=Wenzhouxiangella sp. XN79A TaxID=2724193 RepID=UPI00144A5B02|nr:serine/threonine-protein kinase [Wenzhouxiangella sp. XN79A]NKI36586.1 protein kinase [Wenzhouxiangella sp. XN79A]
MAKKIGDYEIISELGRGGMGVVYMAREESLQRNVAIKMLGNQLVNDDAVAERFIREARVVADLNHPNLVQVFRVDRHEDQPYFVMEFVEGDSLKALIQRERQMQPTRALKILQEVASGLAAAHDKGVVHRDIKPENIMLTRYGGVKVVDFGIARDENAETRLTTTGIGLGTPNYLSPEVCLSQDVDQRSDIFSLGVVLFEMLTGDTPFKSDSPFEMMTKVVEAKIPDIKELNPNVDEGVKKILAKMIAKRPKMRYQHCNELISDIEDYRAGREPRWAKDVVLDEAVETGRTAVPAGEVAETPTVAATAAVPSPDAPPTGQAAAPAARTEALDTGGSSGKGLAVAALFVLLLVGGAGASTWYLLAGSERPLVSWFGEDEGGGVGEREATVTAPAVPSDADPTSAPPAGSGSTDETAAEFAAVGSVNRTDIADDGAETLATTASPGQPVEKPVYESIAGSTHSSMQPAGPDPALAGVDDPSDGSAGFRFDVRTAADEPAGSPDEDADAAMAASVRPADAAPTLARLAEPQPAESAPSAEASEQPPAGLDRPALDPEQAVARVETAPPEPAWNPAAPRVLVIATGDPAVAGPVEQFLEQALNRASFELMDEVLLDGMAYAETLPDMMRAALDAGADILVFADVVPTGERQLQFYGRTDYQYLASLQVRVVALHERRNLGPIVRQKLEYVGLNADEKARDASREVARDVLARLRALRAGAAAAG